MQTCFDLAGDPDPDLRGKPWRDGAHERQIARVFNDALGRRGLTMAHEVAVLRRSAAAAAPAPRGSASC
jgi:hypothetical protein